jgi:threonyl-tRNA synthetase
MCARGRRCLPPIAQTQAAYAARVQRELAKAGLRTVSCGAAETLSRRIVAAHDAGVPVMAILGARDAERGTVALRERDCVEAMLPLADAIALLAGRAPV